MMHIANNELIKTDRRITASKIASTNTNVIAVMWGMIIMVKLEANDRSYTACA